MSYPLQAGVYPFNFFPSPHPFLFSREPLIFGKFWGPDLGRGWCSKAALGPKTVLTTDCAVIGANWRARLFDWNILELEFPDWPKIFCN